MRSLNPSDWSTIQPYFDALEQQTLEADNVEAWLQAWSDLDAQIFETYSRAYRAKMEDTTNQTCEDHFVDLLEHIIPNVTLNANKLDQKWLAFKEYIPTDKTRELFKRTSVSASIFRSENVPLFTELGKLGIEYDKLVGSLEIEIDGEKLTSYAAYAKLELPDRTYRERVYRSLLESWRGISVLLDQIFLKMLQLRRQIAKNAGFENYRDYVWLEKSRFDYTATDNQKLHQIILELIVPIRTQLATQKTKKLGLEHFKPWDAWVSAFGEQPLKPFLNISELESKAANMFYKLDPELGVQFESLRAKNLDLESRFGKGPGGYCDFFPASGEAYIFMNSVGTHDDVQTMLHEAGHAFHALESYKHQSLNWNLHGPMEFCEVASMGMELLASPYLEREQGGFYSPEDAARARSEHLQGAAIVFLPYMAVVDAFQDWIYVAAPEHVTMLEIHQKWAELYQKFLPHLNVEGVEEALSFRWHLQSHIFTAPFYYIEYGIAQLGALQIWQNSLESAEKTVKDYRAALGLGYTKGLADLFSAAGIKLPFDRELVQSLMELVKKHLELTN